MSDPVPRSALRARIDTVSSKAAAAYDDAAPALERLLGPDDVLRWVEIGCAIAAGSAVSGIKFFRESPALLEALPADRRLAVIRTGRSLARSEPNAALEFLRQAGRLIEGVDDAELDQWGRIAAEIAAQDYDAAIEFVKESPLLAGVVPIDSFSLWGHLGTVLSKEDRSVKDFLALTYFRSSADWLRAIGDAGLRTQTLALACRVALSDFPANASRRPGQVALDVLRYAHTLLDALPSPDARHALLSAGLRVADRAPTLVESFLQHAAEVIRLVEGSVTRFEEWVSEGIAIADTHRERAEAYFTLRSKQAVEVAQRLSRGIFLRDVKSMLTYVAEALCGRSVEIRSGHGASSALLEGGQGLITLPEKITVYPTPEDNLRFYRVLAHHEAAHLEFGTYAPVPPEVVAWFGTPGSAADPESGVMLMSRFPDPGLAQNLWTIAEEARIDFLLRHHYPGLHADMDRVLFEQLRGRPRIETLHRREAILEALLQLSVADSADVPFPVLDPVTEAYDVIKRLRKPEATVLDVLAAVVDLYPIVAQGLVETDPTAGPTEPPPQPSSEFDQLAMGHTPIGSFAFRDSLQPPQVGPGHREPPPTQPPAAPHLQTTAERHEAQPVRRDPSGPGQAVEGGPPVDGGFWYDEWDEAAMEYRPRWSRVDESLASPGSPEQVESLLASTRGLDASLRRHFAAVRPEAFRKVRGQPDGEEIDLDAHIGATVDRLAGLAPPDRLYVRRDKRLRDVAVALLIDTSGSTGRQIDAIVPGVRRVIDVERESLALFASALDAVGDQFAMYAFSGQSRQGVHCRVLKAFDERFGPVVLGRIGGLAPSGQNRDGAAIRHATRRLLAREAAVKLLVLLSDGRPLDDEYAGDYALADTRAALREAREAGVHVFCVTVDSAAPQYIDRLYGDVQYAMIHDINSLPERLPRLYKRLTS